MYWPVTGARGIRTSPGANNDLAEKLADENISAEVIRYLADSKWVHVSSLIDRDCLEIVTTLLYKARQINPSLQISFDPGSEYCRNPTKPIISMMKLANYIFLNWREFYQLAGYEDPTQFKNKKLSEKQLASEIFKSYECKSAMVVLKSYHSTSFFQIYGDLVLARRKWQLPLMPPLVRDDTGAGDVFAAGFIVAHLLPALNFDMKTTISFSSNLVKAKLKTVGHDVAPGYKTEFIRTLKGISLKESFNVKDFIDTYLVGIILFLLGIFISAFGEKLITRLF